jgi:hypothetical protein
MCLLADGHLLTSLLPPTDRRSSDIKYNILIACPHHLSCIISNQKTEELITNPDGSMKWKNECYKTREDYFECLHAKKEWAMVKRVNDEEARQKALAAGR